MKNGTKTELGGAKKKSVNEEVKLVAADEVAKALNITDTYVRMLAREERIPCTRVNGRWRFILKDVLAHMQKNNFTKDENSNKTLVKAQAVADKLGISAASVRKMAQNNTIPCFYLNSRPMFDLDAVVASLRKEAAKPYPARRQPSKDTGKATTNV